MIKKIPPKIYTFVSICVATMVFALFTVSCGNPCDVNNYVSSDNKYTPVTINYATCTPNDGCDLTFQCKPTTSKTAAFFNSVHDIFRNANTLHAAEKIPQDFVITSVVSVGKTPAPLQTDIGPVPSSWYTPSHKMPCTNTNSDVTCKNFAPISNEMLVQGTVYNRPVKFYITVDTSKIKKSAPGKVTICGQLGVNSKTSYPSDYSTAQRVFDCFARVTDFAGLGNGDGTFTAFIPGSGSGSPNYNWFLAACFDTNMEHCSWLTPIIPMSDATGAGQYLSTVNGTEGALTSTLIGKRILFSGLLANNYNFFEANGKNPWNIPAASTSQGQYDYYPFINYPNQNALRNISPNSQICAPSNASGCTSQKIASTQDMSYNSSTATMASICERQTGKEGALLSSYSWQVPSYPILKMITGGKSNGTGDCESGGSAYIDNHKSVCLSTQNSNNPYLGFRAIDPIPSFQTNQFWSSSVGFDDNAWCFEGVGIGAVYGEFLSTKIAVRCVTPASDL